MADPTRQDSDPAVDAAGSSDSRPPQSFGHVSPTLAGLKGACPRCGRGPLFRGLLDLRSECDVCGLDMREADPGDGPAVFVVLILGFLAGGLGLMIEMSAHPPLWVHMIVLIPFILGGTVALLRIIKGLLISYQFYHDAHEARLDHNNDTDDQNHGA